MIPKSRSDLGAFHMPHNVQEFHAGLCDELGVRRYFWLFRSKRHRFRPRERFVIMCIAERMNRRFHWSYPDIGAVLGMSHGSLLSLAIGKKADALFGMYSDLALAVRRMDGYQAGRFIVDRWRTPIMLVCGESPAVPQRLATGTSKDAMRAE